ncbi:MAG: DUF1735 domain-containing protein [Sphingobacteriaceae bacterium]|nr:MAG: DUF1735 domain-containing protein [Sphingobacteriaceae bacterium]
MKAFKLIPFLSLIGLLAIIGCEKNDKDATFGGGVIFMPQAYVSSPGFAIPQGRDSSNFNYRIDSAGNKVNIILSASCSGSDKSNGFTVNVAANTDTVQQMITKKILDSARTLVLPTAIYTLPTTVTVPQGQSSATFNLSINRTQLKTYTGKKMALGVTLSSPTAYTLNPALNKVVVVIDVDALRL